jgi:hypothetical protein
MLTDDEHRKTIDRYPNIENLHYQPPDTIPSAARNMNRYQSKQDMLSITLGAVQGAPAANLFSPAAYSSLSF